MSAYVSSEPEFSPYKNTPFALFSFFFYQIIPLFAVYLYSCISKTFSRTNKDQICNNISQLHCLQRYTFCLCLFCLRCAVQEFADNLQGKGIHGAVMALDPSFDTDAMAKALGIPSNKHMLHRHLYEEMKSLAVPHR